MELFPAWHWFLLMLRPLPSSGSGCPQGRAAEMGFLVGRRVPPVARPWGSGGARPGPRRAGPSGEGAPRPVSSLCRGAGGRRPEPIAAKHFQRLALLPALPPPLLPLLPFLPFLPLLGSTPLCSLAGLGDSLGSYQPKISFVLNLGGLHAWPPVERTPPRNWIPYTVHGPPAESQLRLFGSSLRSKEAL